jgi:hypothetical protein
MIFKVTAMEDIKGGEFVSVFFNDSNQIHCRKALLSEPPDAIAARKIVKDEIISFDTGRDTSDLLRPTSNAYKGD